MSQFPELVDQCLENSSDADCLVNPCTHVTNAKFQCWIVVIGTHVEPDLGAIRDGVCFYQRITITDKVCKRIKVGRNPSTGKVAEDNASVRLEAGFLTNPEG